MSAAVFSTIVEISGFMDVKCVGLDFTQNLEWTLAVSALVLVWFLCVGSFVARSVARSNSSPWMTPNAAACV